MSLQSFLKDNEEDILKSAEKNTLLLAALRPNSAKLKTGLPIFFGQLVVVLGKKQSQVDIGDESEIFRAAKLHGRELLRLGYTLSHVVHSYGAMCQAITEVASNKKAEVTAIEFHNLNRCLDIAIAGAVTEFDEIQNSEIRKREVIHLGIVAHELRNALNRATISFEMLSKGIVGLGGSTSKVLGYSLHEMNILIDKALSNVRLRAGSDLLIEKFSMLDVISHIAVTAEVEASKRGHTLVVDIDDDLLVNTDKHLILSAVGNLIQNAIKYSHPKSEIKISAKKEGTLVALRIQDECGGFPTELENEIFRPFVQRSSTESGLGLGLLIAKEAIEKCEGTLKVNNLEKGCVFTVTLPLAPVEVVRVNPIV